MPSSDEMVPGGDFGKKGKKESQSLRPVAGDPGTCVDGTGANITGHPGAELHLEIDPDPAPAVKVRSQSRYTADVASTPSCRRGRIAPCTRTAR